MPRGGDRDRRRSPKDTGRRTAKKKVCVFCSEHIKWVDYKDVNLLRRFMSDRGKIRARRVSGNCAQHQRDVAVAIKTARDDSGPAAPPADAEVEVDIDAEIIDTGGESPARAEPAEAADIDEGLAEVEVEGGAAE